MENNYIIYRLLSLLLMVMFAFTVTAQQSVGYRLAKEKLPSLKGIRSLVEFETTKKFIEQELDFQAIENTLFWKEYIQYWVAFYARPETSPETFAGEFVPVAKNVIDRVKTNSPQTAMHLSNDLIDFFDQYGLDNAAASIAAYAVYEIDVHESEYSIVASRILTAVRLEQGGTAPALSGMTDTLYKNSIIVFYDTNCGNCEWQMEQLADTYNEITEKGYRIISISADNNKDVFYQKSKEFPWEDRLCDYKGMEGENFKNYGVISTPVFYLTDSDGKVIGKYARIDNIKLTKIGEK